MLNNNYALQQAKKLGHSVERVRNDDIELYIAKNNPKYIETSNDRPNFYAKFLYDKAKETNPNLTKEEFVDSEILKYEQNNLELVKIDNKGIVAIYMVDNINLVMTIRPYAIAQQLGIDIKEIYALNYIKVVLKDTNETKYMWIDSFVNNESRKESITLSCSTDMWLTYYKQIILNINGDIKIIRKHFDRFVERNGRLIGNYASDSNIHNVDSQFANLTTGTVRSLGCEVNDGKTNGEQATINIPNNKIIFEFYVEGKKFEEVFMGQKFLENSSNLFSQSGSGKPFVFSAYDINGTLQKEPTAYKNGNVKFSGKVLYDQNVSITSGGTKPDIWDKETWGCYGPKTILRRNDTIKGDYIYVRKYQDTEQKIDSYGIIISDNPIKSTPNIINRIDNVYNGWLKNDFGSITRTTKANQDWRYVVMTETPNTNLKYNTFETIYRDIKPEVGVNTVLRRIKYGNSQLKLYLVDYNSRNGYGDYSIKVDLGANIIYGFYDPTLETKITTYITLSNYALNNKSLTYNTSAKCFVGVCFNGTIDFQNYGYIKNGEPWMKAEANINDSGIYVDLGTKTKEYTITEWNKKSTLETNFTNEIYIPEFSDLMEPLKLRFSPVEYQKNSNWKYDREPQLKMGHCIKHFIDYLGVRKQLFLEFGNVDKIYLTQSILPNGAIDKIYYTDSEKDYNMWELINTNGFLTKQYDNSIPSLSDTYTQFLSQNQAQLQNGYLTANTNLDFAKQQASLNTQQQQLDAKKGIFGDVIGMVGDVIGGAGQIAGGIASGNPFSIGMGAAKATTGVIGGIGDFVFGSQQREIDRKQTELNNQKMIFSAESQINSLDAMVKDKFNQPDQLNVGSIEVNGILRYKEDLSTLFQTYGVNGNGANFKIDTQTPTKTQLMEYSQFLHQNGYISNNLYFNQDIDTLLSRTRFNFIQIGDIQNMFKNVKANIMTKNYFMNMFNKGVRLWNVGYENQQMLDYSKENWEIELENASQNK